MELFLYRFPVSGVETYLFVPPLVMFLISALTSMGGVSGAFVLLPFQISLLGYTAPGVSGTNFVYNIVAIPMGVRRYIQEGRLAWTLYLVIILGTLPGVFVGYYVRIRYLPEPHRFKFFAGLVLACMGIRILYGLLRDREHPMAQSNETPERVGRVTWGRLGLARTAIVLEGEPRFFPTLVLFPVALVVGVVGAAYGIGGGSIIAPFCISVLNLPVHAVAGAVLLCTWSTSVVAALFYGFIPLGKGLNTSPDWLLGVLFGLGGMAGIYLGTRLQGYVPASLIKLILSSAVLLIAAGYTWPVLKNVPL